MQTPVLAFDVYGTLVDTQGVVAPLASRIGDDAVAFAERWRDKQFEFAFRRGLMGAYVDFFQCQREALDLVDQERGSRFTEEFKQGLMVVYRRLPAFKEVPAALERLRGLGVRCVAFSNGSRQSLESLFDHAGLTAMFDDIISVEEVRRYKPDAVVYAHLRQRTHSRPDNTWLVSSNPFDVIGARHAGLRAAWIQRNPNTPFEPWGDAPDMMAPDLEALSDQFQVVLEREGKRRS
ncbi:haloacid dehalogenase type II [Salinicola socius]|uniref:(S)-2-haloacid dehalogenase n=1 Tax=Salinicola socius TaxID=404433 RepID=A0A1Q8SPZ3_9GAMM|nr:haloacid dehalogenase type II [Salinicola socius]OLO03518.1 haloacid dehalogenase, type II [Salinicola socius]